MVRTVWLIALGAAVSALAVPLWAQSTPPPPEWQDGASVYLAVDRQPSGDDAVAAPAVLPRTVEYPVATASHEELAPPSSSAGDRRLPPPSGARTLDVNSATDAGRNRLTGPSRSLAEFGLPTESLYTIASALAIVLGAFLTFAWLLRRGGRTRANLLPADAVSVLGRTPLAARHYAELLRVGNKLVLVSLTPGGAETITEVTDPVEVDRLVGLCQQNSPHSTTQAFEQVFRQLSSEPASGRFLEGDSLPAASAIAAHDYRAHEGGGRT